MDNQQQSQQQTAISNKINQNSKWAKRKFLSKSQNDLSSKAAASSKVASFQVNLLSKKPKQEKVEEKVLSKENNIESKTSKSIDDSKHSFFVSLAN